mmetsp:Transcript_40493/g.118015  ORF Transcript_40493/g.118015 Transcript_40493/m.118015 type:complete len:287 (+) Transcript_40493:297-1157(+)
MSRRSTTQTASRRTRRCRPPISSRACSHSARSSRGSRPSTRRFYSRAMATSCTRRPSATAATCTARPSGTCGATTPRRRRSAYCASRGVRRRSCCCRPMTRSFYWRTTRSFYWRPTRRTPSPVHASCASSQAQRHRRRRRHQPMQRARRARLTAVRVRRRRSWASRVCCCSIGMSARRTSSSRWTRFAPWARASRSCPTRSRTTSTRYASPTAASTTSRATRRAPPRSASWIPPRTRAWSGYSPRAAERAPTRACSSLSSPCSRRCVTPTAAAPRRDSSRKSRRLR